MSLRVHDISLTSSKPWSTKPLIYLAKKHLSLSFGGRAMTD